MARTAKSDGAIKRRQPQLKADCTVLAELYTGKMAVTAKELTEIFGIGESTAYKVVEYIYEYAEQHDRVIYVQPGRKLVPTDILFEAYGWDLKQIIERVRLLKKIS